MFKSSIWAWRANTNTCAVTSTLTMSSSIVIACVAACVASAMTVVLCLLLLSPHGHTVPMIAPPTFPENRATYEIVTRSPSNDIFAVVIVAAVAIIAIVAVKRRDGEGGGGRKCVVFIAQRVGHHSSGNRNNATIATIIGDHIDVVMAVWTRDEADPADPGNWDIDTDSSQLQQLLERVLDQLVQTNRGAFLLNARLQSLVDAMTTQFSIATASQLASFFGTRLSKSQRDAALSRRIYVLNEKIIAIPIMSPGCNAHRNAPHIIALAVGKPM